MSNIVNVFWFRQDLRIADNPGLSALQNSNVLPIYILDLEDISHMGSASKWWLHHSLIALNDALDNKLNLYIGNTIQILAQLKERFQIHSVYWNRCYEPNQIKRDINIKKKLTEFNINCTSFNGSLLREPWEILKSDNSYYKIYSHFCRRGYLEQTEPRLPLKPVKNTNFIKDLSNNIHITNLNLLPTKSWHKKFNIHWQIGEKAAQEKLQIFIANSLKGYKEQRNYPGASSTSKLSPHIHFGEISINTIWHQVKLASIKLKCEEDASCFLRELIWREFSYYLLYHIPELPSRNFHPKFDAFPWQEDNNLLIAWQKGQTGYPIIDAGMRELWQTGYMHNRVRMIVGSFLVKNLLLHWHVGAKWFFDCLLDADVAVNTINWQWVAGSGIDAAPYFRIFNPITQGEKFDLDGTYTRRFVPELINLPNKYLFKPWEAPDAILKASGIILGKTYPKPIIDLKFSRERALNIFRNTCNAGE